MSPCPICGGVLALMGVLGWTAHGRCRSCGIECSEVIDAHGAPGENDPCNDEEE